MADKESTAWEKLVLPALVALATPTFTLIGSKLVSGDWLRWLQEAPSWTYAVFFAVLVSWAGSGFVIRRITELKRRNLPSLPIAFSIPMNGYQEVATLDYQGVKWKIQIAAPGRMGYLGELPKSVNVDTPPRCPNCETAIEETETFLGRFRWSCTGCIFTTTNKMGYHHEAERVRKLADAWWEKERVKLSNQ